MNDNTILELWHSHHTLSDEADKADDIRQLAQKAGIYELAADQLEVASADDTLEYLLPKFTVQLGSREAVAAALREIFKDDL